MGKIKVTADTILAIINGIMADEEINYLIEDKTAPIERVGKTVQEALNVEYYTFRHRPADTEQIIREMIRQGNPTNSLYALTRSFCLLSLSSTERIYSKDNDVVMVSANLEYWIQSSKVELLEDLIENLSIKTNGIRFPVQIGEESRRAIIVFGGLSVTELQETTEFGEMSVCEIAIDIVFYPNVISRTDYTAEFQVEGEWVKLPFSSISISNSMTQKSVPRANQVRNVGSINLSKVKSIVFSFDGYVNSFVDKITNQSLASDITTEGGSQEVDNNEQLILRLTRGEDVFFYDCVVKDHLITVQEDTGNEIHSLTLTTRGMKNGSS